MDIHCPGFEANRELESYKCKCACGAELEIFSDEISRTHTCKSCGQEIEPTQCHFDAGVKGPMASLCARQHTKGAIDATAIHLGSPVEVDRDFQTRLKDEWNMDVMYFHTEPEPTVPIDMIVEMDGTLPKWATGITTFQWNDSARMAFEAVKTIISGFHGRPNIGRMSRTISVSHTQLIHPYKTHYFITI